jgi:hypothetical protein
VLQWKYNSSRAKGDTGQNAQVESLSRFQFQTSMVRYHKIFFPADLDSVTYYVSQTSDGCESNKVPICVDNTISATPVLTQTSIDVTTTTLSGTRATGSRNDLASLIDHSLTVGALPSNRCLNFQLN